MRDAEAWVSAMAARLDGGSTWRDSVPTPAANALTPHLIATVENGLTDAQRAIFRWRFRDDEAAGRLLYSALHRSALRKGFGPLQAGRAANAVMEELSRPCPVCKSQRAVQTKGGRIETCGACSGSGDHVWSDRERARFVQIPESTWRANWENRYRSLFLEVYQPLQKVISAIQLAMRGD